jgi:carboxypeptidase T
LKLLSVEITSDSLEKMRDLDQFDLYLRRRNAYQKSETQFVVPAITKEEQLKQLESLGYNINILSDLSKVAPQRLKEVSHVDRFQVTALDEFEGYMSTDTIETALTDLHNQFPDITTLIELPHKTWEKRTSHALCLRAGKKEKRVGVLFTGGVHAREWGGPDICINFIVQLLQAYHNNTSILYGGKTFTANQVKTIMENLDIFVFPLVNPDGRAYSQSHDNPHCIENENVWWRKNRRPNDTEKAMGVDLNRNYDFLWNSGIGTETVPSTETYRGPEPFSEPESKNVRYLFDTYPHIQFYVDIHSFGGLILYNWGDDDNQNSDPAQNFHNPTYDGKRGTTADTVYREFIPADDERLEAALANRMNQALKAVRNQSYKVQQAAALYPTSATSDDYAFSRNMIDPIKEKVYSFTIEFGTNKECDGSFIPSFTEMKEIIKDVSSALTELCLATVAA